MNTSGPITPSNIVLARPLNEFRSTVSPVRSRGLMSSPRLIEVVTEAHARPARRAVCLLIEAERAGEVERVGEILLIRHIVDEGIKLPALAVWLIRCPQVCDRVALL